MGRGQTVSSDRYIAFARELGRSEENGGNENIENEASFTLIDPLSLIANAIAVVGLAGSATKLLTRLVKTLLNAPDELHALINEVADLQAILNALKEIISVRNKESDRKLAAGQLKKRTQWSRCRAQHSSPKCNAYSRESDSASN
jgi:Fungal N-terminal domain of STAND proteins